jgi:hypothetical protein
VEGIILMGALRDPRRASAPSRPGRAYPDMRGWPEDPPDVLSTHGAPRSDEARWWRLQPGERAGDGTMVRLSVVHRATCVDWPPGRHAPGWSFHTRPEARRLLERDDEVIPCPKCRPRSSL